MADTTAPEKPTVAGAESDIKKVLKDTFVGGMINDAIAAEEKTATEKPPEKPAIKEVAPETKPAKPETKSGEGETKPPAAETTPAEPETKSEEPKQRHRRPPPPQAPALDVSQLARDIATATVQAQTAAQRQTEAAATGELPDPVKKLVPAYEELHRANPQKYPADLALRMGKFVKDEESYADKWMAEHPGEDYDADDEQHSEWYEKHQPQIDKEDFEDAKTTIRARQLIQKEVAPHVQTINQKVEAQRLDPALREAAAGLSTEIVKSVVPKFDGAINKESMDKLKAENPTAFEVVSHVDNVFANVVYESGRLWHGVTTFDQNQPLHQAAREILSEFESMLSDIEPKDLVRRGKPWVPLARYHSLTPEQQAQVYTTKYGDVVDYIRQYVAPGAAKKIYEERAKKEESLIAAIAPRHGYVKANASAPSQSNTPAPAQNPQQPAPTINSPAVTPGTPNSNNQSGSNSGNGSFEDMFFSKMGLR